MDRVDAVVTGAGVVGVAIGRALALCGIETVVLQLDTDWTTSLARRRCHSYLINEFLTHPGIVFKRAEPPL